MSVHPSAKVLLVGAEQYPQGLANVLERLGWSAQALPGIHAALRHLREEPDTDMVVMLPDLLGNSQVELCRTIKLDQRTRFTAVLAVHATERADAGAAVLLAGADDCLRSDTPEPELEARLLRSLRHKRATDHLEDSEATVVALAAAIEGKDHYTCGHVERVSAYAVEIGQRVGVESDALATLRLGGIVHDIGKVGVPDQVLNKPGKLTEEEMEQIRRHPVLGYEILKPLRTFRAVLPIVRWHHERPNGTGYPDGLQGVEVPLLARITAVADVFDALATDRPYRPALPLAKCQQILLEEAKRGSLDLDIVRVLLGLVGTGAGAEASSPSAS